LPVNGQVTVQRAACTRAFLVMVASRSDLGRPDAVLRLTLLKTIVSTPPLTPLVATGPG